ncbi:MAG: Glu-tRNA(Gln) amidotransferase subunit E-like FAD-binding protein [Cyclobacteriaceae bacterium]
MLKNMQLKLSLLITLFGMLVANSHAVLAADLLDETFPGVETLMNQEEMQATGVSELSAAQVRALNEWLINYTAKDAPTLLQYNEEIKTALNQPVSTRIVGTFTGWRGETKVTLENGETWQQRHKSKWIVKMENPEVVIEKNVMNFYKMTFVESGRAMGVKRVDTSAPAPR